MLSLPQANPDSTIARLRSVPFSARSARPRILAAALKLMKARPWTRPSILDISKATGLSRRAVYNHFPDPEALHGTVLAALVDELAHAFDAVLPRETEPAILIGQHVRFLGGLMDSPGYRLLICAMFLEAPDGRAIGDRYVARIREPTVRGIETYMLYRRIIGEFADTEPRAAAEQLVGMVEYEALAPYLLRLHRSGDGISEDRLAFLSSTFIRAHVHPLPREGTAPRDLPPPEEAPTDCWSAIVVRPEARTI